MCCCEMRCDGDAWLPYAVGSDWAVMFSERFSNLIDPHLVIILYLFLHHDG